MAFGRFLTPHCSVDVVQESFLNIHRNVDVPGETFQYMHGSFHGTLEKVLYTHCNVGDRWGNLNEVCENVLPPVVSVVIGKG
jgi:hypothetical protein